MNRVLIGEMLVLAKALTREQLDEALAVTRPSVEKIGQIFVERGWITEAQLTQTLSLQLSIPWVSLIHIDFSRQLLNRVPRELAERFCLIPIFIRQVKGQGETLYLAMEDPINEAALADVSKAAGLQTRPMIASPSDIRSAIRLYYAEGELEALTSAATIDAAARDATTVKMFREGQKPPVPVKPPSTPAAAAPVTPAVSSPTAISPIVPPPVPVSAKLPPKVAVPVPADARSSSPSFSTSTSEDAPDSSPDVESTLIDLPPRKRPNMVALTLLDGTTISVPAKKKSERPSSLPPGSGLPDQLTARDLISALRAVAHGADASEILGDSPRWEPVLAALLSLLLKKGLISDREFVEEFRKV